MSGQNPYGTQYNQNKYYQQTPSYYAGTQAANGVDRVSPSRQYNQSTLVQQGVNSSQQYNQSSLLQQQQQQPQSQVNYQQQYLVQSQQSPQYLQQQQVQAYRGESRIHSFPIERKVIEYEQVPVEKTYVDQEVIEYQTEYVPRIEYDTYVEQVPVKSIEYVPVQRIDYVPQERVDYVPQERRVERVEYDMREIPVRRGVQQTQVPLQASQVGEPILTHSQVQYQPYQQQQQQQYQGTSYPQYSPSVGAQIVGSQQQYAKQPEYAKPSGAKSNNDTVKK